MNKHSKGGRGGGGGVDILLVLTCYGNQRYDQPGDEQGLNTDLVPDDHLECDMKILSDVMIHTNTFMFRLTLYSSQAQVLGFNLTFPMDPSSNRGRSFSPASCLL